MFNNLIILEGLLVSVLVSYIYTNIKYNNNKINIMNVRNELNKIRKIEENERNRKF